MKVLVTGGCGFIGTNFIMALLDEEPGCEVVNLDALTYAGNPRNSERIRDGYPQARYSLVVRDICELPGKGLEHAPFGSSQPFDWVVNFAAESHVDRSVMGSDAFTRSNVVGAQRLMDWMLSLPGAERPRLLQVSTDEVYGDVGLEASFEEDRLHPSSPYSASKAAADLLVMAYGRTFGLDYIITRSSNNFGPFQHPEKLIPKAITRMVEGRTVPVYGDGRQRRDWIPVSENARAILHLMDVGIPGEVYNIGSGETTANIDIIRFLADEVGVNVNRCTEFTRDRPGHDRRYCLDNTKLLSTGFAFDWDFKVSLRETVGWYRDNRDWWEPLANIDREECFDG